MSANHTLSNIISYIYGRPFNTARMDAFNKANIEIIQFLKGFGRQSLDQHQWSVYKHQMGRSRSLKPLYWRLFDYIVNRKLDNSEILKIDDSFESLADITTIWKTFKNSDAAHTIDLCYKKHNLELPPFKTWNASDFNKGPSDRGELKPDAPEFVAGPEGLAKGKYNNYGEKSVVPLEEIRMLIIKILEESFKN